MKTLTQKMVEVAVGHDGGLVVLRFDRDINYLEIPPEIALDVAESITKNAFEANDGMKMVGPALKASLIERHKKTLTPRITLMLNNMSHDSVKKNDYWAEQIISTIFSEIF